MSKHSLAYDDGTSNLPDPFDPLIVGFTTLACGRALSLTATIHDMLEAYNHSAYNSLEAYHNLQVSLVFSRGISSVRDRFVMSC